MKLCRNAPYWCLYLLALLCVSDLAIALDVTCTSGMITDTARIVGGEHATVTGLMGPGVDPHLYKATQADLRLLRDADVVLYNGLHLEGRMADVLVRMARSKAVIQVTETIPEDLLREPPEFDGQYDPHVWFDASLWRYAAERIRDALTESDPENAVAYRANAAAFLSQLDNMHNYAIRRMAEIPADARVLITAHDAFGYFGRAYDVEVRGLQGISTAAEYGLRDVDDLVNAVVERGIKAVFVETSVAPQSIEALVAGAQAKGHEVRIGGALYSDAMGETDSAAGTYLGMFRHNVDTIAEALQ